MKGAVHFSATRQQYEVAYDQLLLAQHPVTKIEQQLARQATTRKSELLTIKEQLNRLTLLEKSFQLPDVGGVSLPTTRSSSSILTRCFLYACCEIIIYCR